MRRRRRVPAAVSAAMLFLVVLLVVDISTPQSVIVFVPLFAVSPLIASLVLTPRATAAFGLLATGLAVVSGTWDNTFDEGQHYVRVAEVLLISMVAVAFAASRARTDELLAQVRAIAETAQRVILPTVPQHADGLRITARYISATEEALVGGDLYDMFRSPSASFMLIGDVKGKGLAGVAQAARVIRAFRQSAAAEPDVVAVARAMQDYLIPFLNDEDFVTALVVDFSDDHRLTLVSCGHPLPLLSSGGQVRSVQAVAGPPLGLAEEFRPVVVPWEPSDRVLLYTDGLIEARNRRGEYLPFDTILEALTRPDPDSTLEELLAAIATHVPGGLLDDVALVLIDNVGSAPQVGWPAHARDATPSTSA